jgi:hypothetical protein
MVLFDSQTFVTRNKHVFHCMSKLTEDTNSNESFYLLQGENYSCGIYPLTCCTSRLRLKCDGTRTETRFRLSANRTSPFKSAGASVQSTTSSRVVRISSSNAGCTMFRGCVKGTGYPLHSPVSPSFPLPCLTVCHHFSSGLYKLCGSRFGDR